MSQTLSHAWADAWIRSAQVVLAEHRMELIDLDRAIGDGDHGENMDRGFKAVVARLDDGGTDDVQGVLKVVASTLMSKVGGAAGPLYGTAFLRAAKAVEGEVDAAAVVALIEACTGRDRRPGQGDHGREDHGGRLDPGPGGGPRRRR